MRNLLERTFYLYALSLVPGIPRCRIKAVVNKNGIKFYFKDSDGDSYEFDAECNMFLGLLFSDIKAFSKMTLEKLSYVPFTKKSQFVSMYCDCFDWEHITRKIQEQNSPYVLEEFKDIKGGIGLKFNDEDAFEKPDFYLEIRPNGDTVSLAFAHMCAGYVASAETVSKFSEGVSEYFEIISNDKRKLKLSYDNYF